MRALDNKGHITVRDGDPMQFHSYELRSAADALALQIKERVSCDTAGIARCLGLQADTKVELQTMLEQIEAKLPQSAPLKIGGGHVPISKTANLEADDD